MGKQLSLEDFDASVLQNVAQHARSVSFKEGHSYLIFLDQSVDERAADEIDEALTGLNVPAIIVLVDDVRNVKCIELKRKTVK